MTLRLTNIDLSSKVLDEPTVWRYFTFQNGVCFYMVDIPKIDSDSIVIYKVNEMTYYDDEIFADINVTAIWSEPLKQVPKRQIFVGQNFSSLVIQIGVIERPQYLYVHASLISFYTESLCFDYIEIRGPSGVFYPYLNDDQYTYLLLEKVKTRYVQTERNPYIRYYLTKRLQAKKKSEIESNLKLYSKIQYNEIHNDEECQVTFLHSETSIDEDVQVERALSHYD